MIHYFQLAGGCTDSDNAAEIADIIDCILKAVEQNTVDYRLKRLEENAVYYQREQKRLTAMLQKTFEVMVASMNVEGIPQEAIDLLDGQAEEISSYLSD